MATDKHTYRRRYIRRHGKLMMAAAAWLVAQGGLARAEDDWANNVSGDWSTGNNWSTGNPPVMGDNVTNSFSGITISYSTNASVSGINNVGGLTVNGGTLQAGTIDSFYFTVNGGSVSGTQANSASQITSGTMSFNGGVISSATLSTSLAAFTGTSTLSNINIAPPPFFAFTTMSFASPSTVILQGTNTFAATISISGSGLTLAPNALLVNTDNGSTYVKGAGTINGSGGANGGIFQNFNFGTVDTNTPDQTLTFANSLAGFQNIGNMQAINGGQIIINAPMSNAPFQQGIVTTIIASTLGETSAIPGTLLQFPPPNALPGTVNINSTLETNGVLNGNLANHLMVIADHGGTINIAGLWTATATTVAASTGGTINVTGGMTGSFNFQTGTATDAITVAGGSIFDAQLVGNWNISSAQNVPFTSVVVVGQDNPTTGLLAFNGLPTNDQLNGSGSINMSGATLTINAGAVKVGRPGASTQGLLVVGSGGIVQGFGNIVAGTLPGADEISINPAAGVVGQGELEANVAGQTLNVDANILNQGLIKVTQGAIFNVGVLEKFSLGGTFQNDGAINYTGGSTLTFGGRLFGNGTVNSNVTNSNGAVQPGDSLGTLRITGNYAQPSGTLDIALGGHNQGVDYSLLTVDGSAALAGTLEVDLVNGFAPQIGDQFTVLTAGLGVSGGFTNLTSNNGLFTYTVDYGQNNNIAEITVTSVPEPASSSLAAIGGLGLLQRRTRRKKGSRVQALSDPRELRAPK